MDILSEKKLFQSELQNLVDGLPRDLQTELDTIAASWKDEPRFWEWANFIGNYYNKNASSDEVVKHCRNIIDKIREFQGRLAAASDRTTLVVFGTSGWRGVIGEDFHVLNVHKVVRGIIEMMRSHEFMKTTGLNSFDDVQQKGVLLLRDNRFMGDVFAEAAMRELAAAGIKIYDAGQCPTGVGSALLTGLGAAGSINFTPSHNPMDYAGIKFNPADGGPADKNLTSIIEQKANAYMSNGQSFTPAEGDFSGLRQSINAAGRFREFVENKSTVFGLSVLRSWLENNRNDLFILVDNMHGASRGYIEALLGEALTNKLKSSASLQFINTNDDFSFHGVKPEPSAANQKPLISRLQNSNRPLTLAVALDPDADRIRYADARMDIDMNRFGAIAYATLLEQGFTGGVASTAPSSDFALEIARREGQPVFETAVGFKFFRQPLKSGQVLLAFEESDGISVKGHTLEKCALAGFLLALQVMSAKNMNLSQVYEKLQQKYGYFYPDKAGAEVKGVSVEKWQNYKQAVLKVLQGGLFRAGDSIEIMGKPKVVRSVNTIDGLKLIFDDKSWILLRPSGTEPKFRYYYELAATKPISDERRMLEAYNAAAATILQKARDLVDNRN